MALYRVSGHSMQPTYRSGDVVLGWRWFRAAQLRPSQVLVATQAGRPVIKRLAAITAAGLILTGDNPADSLDSRQLGAVPPAAVEAVILARVSF
ncbi:MAG TPA: S24 family peptidase [Candidatus Saccharimonadia bacterium]